MISKYLLKDVVLPALLPLIGVPIGAALLVGSFKPNMLIAGVVCAFIALVANFAICRQFHGGRLPKDPPKGSLLYKDWNDWWAWYLATPRYERSETRESLMLFNRLKDESTRPAALEEAMHLPNFPKMVTEIFRWPLYELDVILGKERGIHTAMNYGMRYPRFDKEFVPITYASISEETGALNTDALDLFLANGAQINDADIHGVNVLEALADAHLKRRASPFADFDPVHLVLAAKACQERGVVLREEALAKFRELGDEGRQVVAMFDQVRLEEATAPAAGVRVGARL